MVLDGFAHVLPRSFAEAFLEACPIDRQLPKMSKPIYFYFHDMENRVRVLDKYGIDKQILTLQGPDNWTNISPTEVLRLTRLANDTIKEAANKFPDRFIPVAHIALPTEESLPEFDRCINELEMGGIQVLSNIGGKFLDDPLFRPFLSKANATKTPIWIHPQHGPAGWSEEYILDKIFGWPYETSAILLRLVFSGLMVEYPDLRIITHHMGAMVPHFSERIKGFYEARDFYPESNVATIPGDPLDYFRRFYADTMVTGALHAFECGYKFFGPEHIVMATDYPFGAQQGELWIKKTIDQVRALDMPEAERDMIMSGNMLRLVNRR